MPEEEILVPRSRIERLETIEAAAVWVLNDAAFKAPEQLTEVDQRWLARLNEAVSSVHEATSTEAPKPHGWDNNEPETPSRLEFEEQALRRKVAWSEHRASSSSGFYPAAGEVPASDAVLDAIVEDLRDWWNKTAEADFDAMAPKIGEYTSSDLVLMGQFMEHWLGLPDGSGAEAATLWYALGKVARAVAAYREGRLPSDDTLHDLSVYAMMARRIRETGRWP